MKHFKRLYLAIEEEMLGESKPEYNLVDNNMNIVARAVSLEHLLFLQKAGNNFERMKALIERFKDAMNMEDEALWADAEKLLKELEK